MARLRKARLNFLINYLGLVIHPGKITRHFKEKMLTFIFLFLIIIPFTSYAQEQVQAEDLFEMSLEELMNVKVTLASGLEESMVNAPATMIVITSEEIKQRGYTSLSDVIIDLPGFDISVPSNGSYIYVHQRGYRTPYTTRTLLMIDGKVNNYLWDHVAQISRQYPILNIKRIEVLYGPASALYGANAFLGIINVITKDGKELNKGETSINIGLLGGSFNTRGVEVFSQGNGGNLKYAVTARVYNSDNPDFSDRWGFLSNDLYSNGNIWGPLLDIESNGKKLGEYYSPLFGYSIIGNIIYKNVKLGLNKWYIKEGYGTQIAADKGQSNAGWTNSLLQLYFEYEKNITYKVKTNTLLLYSNNTLCGDWAEALPDWNPGMEDYSFISYTYWNCLNSNVLFKQNFEIDLNDNTKILSGLKYEWKKLTKAYDIPGYWGVFSSSIPSTDPGPYGYGFGVGHSTDSTYTIPPMPSSQMPPANLIYTDDYGGYVQGVFDLNNIRFNGGFRYDYNSIYGGTVNPRISAIYKLTEKGAVKLIYGEAFQEPPPSLLWGGWNGRNANPDLKPEKVRNLEAVVMYRTGLLLHGLSVFKAHYNNVIKEEAENAGKRDVFGLEYRLRFSLGNFITNSSDISGNLYYTYTKTESSIHYNHLTGIWEDGKAEVGDIAPHKVNFGVNLPLRDKFNLFLNGNYVSAKDLYLRNPLRAQNRKLDSYLTMNCNLSYSFNKSSIALKVLNLFDKEYFHSGVRGADSGDDFEHRSLGFYNSLLPQPGRSFILNLTFDF